ncbi:MAG: carcinine hydrolase/isopenicillin-N N-acyltransferase family protein [Caldisericia bacterium]|nr:carcinine hydrolase/isopenicillin-N N-acyltransferase family protein [Caldisericia bacterium]
MCDTFVALGNRTLGGKPIFGKNSDRDPNEPQIFVFMDNRGVLREKVKTTYIEIEPYEVKYRIFLSKPVWLWGGEMGINECGVAIGNEAVFTKIKYKDLGLTGMDMIRIALETSSTSFEAVKKIIELNEKYGQGGNCGYEKKIKYHNSFLISDSNEAYVLEIVDKYFAYKKVKEVYNISNKLSIKNDYDEIHKDLNKNISFEKYFSNKIYTYFSGSIIREKRGRELLEKFEKHSLDSFIKILSDKGVNKFASMRNISMNAGGGLVSSQTTSSMIVEYGKRNIIWFTMSPCPEISLFKPTFFVEKSPLDFKFEKELIKIWKFNNLFFRKYIENYEENEKKIKPLKEKYQNKIFELIHKKSLESLSDEELNKITLESFEIEKEYREMGFKLMEDTKKKNYFYFTNYWNKENIKLLKEEKDQELIDLYKKLLF